MEITSQGTATPKMTVYGVPEGHGDHKAAGNTVAQSPQIAGAGSLGNISETTQGNQKEQSKNNALEKFKLQSAARIILPRDRVSTCMRIPLAPTVGIWKRTDNGRAHFSGLATCGSVWVCPVCAAKISERRRTELEIAIDEANAFGMKLYLLTLTVKHSKKETLAEILTKFRKARRLLKNRTGYKAFAKRHGVVGSICALEVTHGENGWHVHTHEILFTRSAHEAHADELLPHWQSACLTAGLQLPDSHGVDLRAGNDEVGNYVSKWGMESELTKSMTKRGRNGHHSPFDFLREYTATGDEAYAELFREYAEQFKGSHQLVWSKGLRNLLGLGAEKTDEEVAEEMEKGSERLGSLTHGEWRLIVSHDKRGEVLHIAGDFGMSMVKDYIERLRHREIGGET